MLIYTELLQIIFYPGIFFIVCLGFFFEWVDRKVYARLQSRYGPLYTGRWGLLQPFADFIKLLSKEDIEHSSVDKYSFRFIPLILLTLPLTAIMCIPFSSVNDPIVSFEGDLIFILFVLTMNAVFTFIAGWASTNRFSIIGGVRTILQLLGYEIPLTIVLICPAIIANTLSINDLVAWQATHLPFILLQPIGFGVAIITLMAELELVPFDIPKAETEIVAGWMTEFSGRKLALIRLSKNVKMVLAASLLASVYLAGPSGLLPMVSVLWFLFKILCIVLIFSSLRASFARFKIDQMLSGSWKYLLPISLIQVALILIVQGF